MNCLLGIDFGGGASKATLLSADGRLIAENTVEYPTLHPTVDACEQSPEDWENIVYDRDDVDFEDEEQRSRYITNCLEQIADASKEMNLLNGEYSLVTSYLTDMEEIEALPKEEREELDGIARRLLTLEQECEKYRGKKNRMRDSDYYHMRKQENEIQEGISKLTECERYGELVRQDLKRLDMEKHADEYRRSELEIMMNNFRGMAVIFLTAVASKIRAT